MQKVSRSESARPGTKVSRSDSLKPGKFRNFFLDHTSERQKLWKSFSTKQSEDQLFDTMNLIRNRTNLMEMDFQNAKVWNKIPVECQDELSQTYKVNIYMPSGKIQKVFPGQVTVIHQLPHFLCWCQLNKYGKNRGNSKGNQRIMFSLRGLYNQISKGQHKGFLYGQNAIRIKPKHIPMATQNVVFFEQLSGIKGNENDQAEKIWIEFNEEDTYLRWLRALMFLLKTTDDTYQGVRDPRRDPFTKDSIYVSSNQIYQNIIEIDELNQRERDVWKDIKITFQDRLYFANGNGFSLKQATEFIIWDKQEMNLDIRTENFLAGIKTHISYLNKKILTSYLQEQAVCEKSEIADKVILQRLKYVNDRLNDDALLNKRDKARMKWDYDYLPTFQTFRFTWKRLRRSLKVYNSMEMSDLNDAVYEACHDLQIKNILTEEKLKQHPCEDAFDALHSQRLCILHELSKIASTANLKKGNQNRAGVRRAQCHLKQQQAKEKPKFDGFNFSPESGYTGPKPPKSDRSHWFLNCGSRQPCSCTTF